MTLAPPAPSACRPASTESLLSLRAGGEGDGDRARDCPRRLLAAQGCRRACHPRQLLAHRVCDGALGGVADLALHHDPLHVGDRGHAHPRNLSERPVWRRRGYAHPALAI
eukprot:1449100-Prymnesium_polylepis.1